MLGARHGQGHQVGDSHNIAGNRDVDLKLKQEAKPPGRVVKTQIAGPHVLNWGPRICIFVSS